MIPLHEFKNTKKGFSNGADPTSVNGFLLLLLNGALGFGLYSSKNFKKAFLKETN